MRSIMVSVFAASVVLAAVPGSALARSRHVVVQHRVVEITDNSLQGLPLTVNRRSWLDPGPVAPVGTGTHYVAASTQFAKTQDQIFAPDGFGNDVIKGQPYVPGPTYPVVGFSTLPNGHVAVDTALLPQNFYFNPAPSVP